jgi:Fe-S oxidoreductase
MHFEFGISNVIYIAIFLLSIGFLAKNLGKITGWLKLAKKEDRSGNVGQRISQTIGVAFFQKKILREPAGGFLHVGIFWGFCMLLFSASNSVFAGFGLHHFWSFLGPIYPVVTVLTDIFCVLIFVAIIFSFLRRAVFKVERLQNDDKSEKVDAFTVLAAILVIVTGLLFENASAIAGGTIPSNAVHPVAAWLANMINPESAGTIHAIAYWIHSLTILAFMNYLPYSKHFHVYSSIPNVYLSNGMPKTLSRIDFEDESIEQYGVTDVNDFTWKTLLDSMTCTHCGRCTSVCPANITGKPLDPREIMVQIRERMMDKMPLMAEAAKSENPEEYEFTEAQQEIMDKPFISDDYQHAGDLWNCTGCGACMAECPVMNEHVPAIVEMRRSKVMMEAEFPEELQDIFTNLENNGAPWQFSQMERADWAEGLEVPVAAQKEEFDTLYWVGCAGSFDDRAKKVSRSFVKILNAAGVDFAILGTEETCNGDVARRSGNEYLADMLVQQNIETMKQYKFKRIVVTCPHCYNTLKNEYPQFGAKYEVIHHSELIDGFIKSGKIKLNKTDYDKVVYHDSCYLGRYNEIYDAPRNVVNAANKTKVTEPDRTKSKGFCCGAGAGQMFMEETEGKRVNTERTEQLVKDGANCISLNCPFCLTMMEDGLKDINKEEQVVVKDIAEIVAEAMG